MTTPLHIGFIPLVDAAALIIAVDKGFAAAEGLDVKLVREVSWSNVRDKLNIGLFDAAHLLAPVAIASSLGLGHVKVPIVAPFNLGLNGNAITVSPALHAAIMGEIEGDAVDPMATALALARVVANRRKSGAEPLTFGMTFPFSTHNYQLRFWMAAGGVDPDEDVRLVVLPPPYMVDSLANGHVDAFCVGAPWNSVAVDLGVGHILHFVSDILVRAAEKVLAVRQSWSEKNADVLAALVRAAVPRRRIHRGSRKPRRDRACPGAARPDRRRRRGDPAHPRRPAEDFTRWPAAREQPLSAGRARGRRRVPIPRRPPGFMRKWCAGGRRRCGRTRSEPPWGSSGRTSTTPPWGIRARPPALPTPSAPLPVPRLTPATSPAIWRHFRSATGSPDRPLR